MSAPKKQVQFSLEIPAGALSSSYHGCTIKHFERYTLLFFVSIIVSLDFKQPRQNIGIHGGQ